MVAKENKPLYGVTTIPVMGQRNVTIRVIVQALGITIATRTSTGLVQVLHDTT